MSGMIADARIYNVAKSDAAVAQMYDPLTRWELYEPERKIWTGWSPVEPDTLIAEPRALVKCSWDLVRPPLDIQFDVNWESPQSDGLVFWMPLMGQEAGSMRFVDKVGGLEMTPYNSPVWTPDGWIGSALLFDDALSEYLLYSSPVLTTVPLTMSCWFNSNDITTRQTLISISDAGNDFYLLQTQGNNIGDPIAARTIESGTIAEALTTSGYFADTWHHGCAVFAAANSRAVYIDAGSKGENATSRTASGLSETVVAGFLSSQFPNNYLSGAIMDVRIYDAAKSDADVAQMYDPLTRWDLYKMRVRGAAGYTPTEEEIMAFLGDRGIARGVARGILRGAR
jgi:hypothetical protein